MDAPSKNLDQHLNAIRPIFARAAIGDFSQDVPLYDPEDDSAELYVGIQVMLDVLREKIRGYEAVRQELEHKVREQEDTQTAILNILEDEEHQKAQAQEERAKYEIIVSSIGEGVIAVDAEQKILLINESAALLLRYKKEESTGKNAREVIPVICSEERKLSEEEYPFTHVIKISKTVTFGSVEAPYYIVRTDGERVPVIITVAPIVHNEVKGAVMVFRNATEDVERSRARSEFITLASHQLKSPMTIIRWAVEWILEKEKLSAMGQKFMNDVQAASVRLTALTDLLLNVSRLEEGMVEVAIQDIDLDALIRDHLALISPYAKEKGITVHYQPAPQPLIMQSDAALLFIVIQILIANALDYTPKNGSVWVTCKREKSSVFFSVKDTGIGIPLHEQYRIFEKFVRTENARKMKADGTGLGLYTARKIFDLLGGRIWFESEEGKGTTFFAEFPKQSKPRIGTKKLVI